MPKPKATTRSTIAIVGAAKVVTPSFSDNAMHSIEGAPGVTTFRTTAPYRKMAGIRSFETLALRNMGTATG
jgi:hypothetical protein